MASEPPVESEKDRDMEVDFDGKDGSEDNVRKRPGSIMMAGASQKYKLLSIKQKERSVRWHGKIKSKKKKRKRARLIQRKSAKPKKKRRINNRRVGLNQAWQLCERRAHIPFLKRCIEKSF
jgi:hypothetical protein